MRKITMRQKKKSSVQTLDQFDMGRSGSASIIQRRDMAQEMILRIRTGSVNQVSDETAEKNEKQRANTSDFVRVDI